MNREKIIQRYVYNASLVPIAFVNIGYNNILRRNSQSPGEYARQRLGARCNGAHFADRVVPRTKRGQVQSFGRPRRRRCIAARPRLHCRYTRSHGGGVREQSNVTWNTIPRRRPWHALFRRRSSFWTLQTPPPPVSPTPSKVVHTRANSYLQ